jgi:hypothetical protein
MSRKPQVFGIGLSRTGTSSLNRALRMLGLTSKHTGAMVIRAEPTSRKYVSMANNSKKRLGAKTRDAETMTEAALGLDTYRSDPDIMSGYPLVWNRRAPYPGANWAESENPIFPPHTAAQRWLATHGFHPNWWLPEALAEKWKTQTYPLKATIESVSQWRRLIETVSELHTHDRNPQEATELRRTLLADMENDAMRRT